MSSTVVRPTPPRPGPLGAADSDRPRTTRRRGLLDRPLPAHWPLSVLVLGFPLWWVLGLAEFVPVLLAVPLAAQLTRRRDVSLPRGFGWWLLFLAWVCLGALVLWSDAPGAVPGGEPSRLLVFGYRAAWYGAVTVWMLWVIDTGRDRLPDRTVHRLVGGLLAVALAGGVLALLAPGFEFRSAIEYVLPAGLRSNAFVEGLVHPEVADVQAILGEEASPRPKAPFAFTNTWGSVVSLSLLFALAALARSSRRARLGWILLLLLIAPAPVLLSLNRGLWASLVLGAVGLVVLLALRGRARLVAGLLAVGMLTALVLAQTPLGEIPAERFGAQHSNERRSLLTEATVSSVSRGSPLVGFGNTRDVEGNFASIAGGSTPDCSACGVPPLGTQGQAWLVLFSQGWVGLMLFGAFLAGALWRSLRCRTVNETLCTFALASLGLQIVIYDTLGLPLLLVFLAIGLMTREQRAGAGIEPQPSARRLARRVRPVVVPGLALVLLGGVGGLGLALLSSEPEWSATTRVVLEVRPDNHPGTASLPGPSDEPGTMTVDTEAALMRAAPQRLHGNDGAAPDRARVTAARNTRVLEVTMSGRTAREAETASAEAVRAWLRMRRQQLTEERTRVLGRLDDVSARLRSADGVGPTGTVLRDSTRPTDRYLASAAAAVAANPLSPGEIITRESATRRPPEVAVPVASGLGLGLLAAALLTLRRSRPRPTQRRIT